MGQSFDHDDVFPIIARLIDAQFAAKKRFIEAPEIADAMLSDSEGARLVAEAQRRSKLSANEIAGNMVAWFSQRISIGQSSWQNAYERTKVKRRWAYRPVGK